MKAFHKDISKINGVKKISLETNGTLLTKQLIDELVDAGLSQFNLSLNSLDQKLAEKIAGCPYNLKHIIDMAKYIAKKCKLVIAPVWIPGINDEEIPKLIEFSKELKCTIGIQNFLNYRYGRNPVKEKSFDKFEKELKELEKQHNVKLLLTEEDFDIKSTKPLPKPFKKGEVLKTKIIASGRLRNEKLAVERDRIISIPNCDQDIGEKVTIKIIRTKHNIFVAQLI